MAIKRIDLEYNIMYSINDRNFFCKVNQPMKKILVTGGAGFIGSNVNKQLLEAGYQTLIIDNLSQGDARSIVGGTLIQADFGDEEMLESLFTNHEIAAVMHFAADTDVGESVINPKKYYQNNLLKTFALVDSMIKYKVDNFIFSSSAAVYGVLPTCHNLKESDHCIPECPYGQTKFMIENILTDYGRAYGLKSCSLRYFNAAGGDPAGMVKNYKINEKNIIPRLFHCLLEDVPFTIYGTDYPTIDGTCLRDYVHVCDLGSAHILAMERLLNGGASACYNLGNGKGHTVSQVIHAFHSVTGSEVRLIHGPRRPGDPPVLQSDPSKALLELGWRPQYLEIEEMILHAWRSLPKGSLAPL